MDRVSPLCFSGPHPPSRSRPFLTEAHAAAFRRPCSGVGSVLQTRLLGLEGDDVIMRNSEFGRRNNAGAYAYVANTPLQVPENEYALRLGARQQQLTAVRALHQRLWAYLAVVALAGIVIAFTTLSLPLISTLWIVLPAVVMLSIIRSLTKNARTHSRVQRIVSFYELGVARLRHQWQGRGISGKEFLPKNHVYASDLDLFGTGSLFELLCTARTGVGRAVLAEWLLNPAECNEAVERQIAVAELRDMIDLREDWASVGGNALDQVSSSAVQDWAEAPSVTFPFYVQALAIGLPICLIAMSIFAHMGLFGDNWLWVIAAPIVLEALLAAVFLKKTRLTAANLVLPSFELALIVPLLDRLEKENFQCSLLKSLHSRLTTS